MSRITLVIFSILSFMTLAVGSDMDTTVEHQGFGRSFDSLFTALIFGAGHIRTFDGITYSLPDFKDVSCTYLLTRDHVSRNFTLLGTRQSVTLLTPDFAVTIDQSNRVKINNSDAYSDLPVYSFRKTVVVSNHVSTIEVRTNYGISLQWDKKRSVCSVELGSKTQGKAVGLLGTNDQLPNNDMQMRNNRMADNIYEFLNAYEVSGRDSCRFNALDQVAPRPPRCPGSHYPRCHQYFSDRTSPLKDCFSTVDPEAFKSACEEDNSICNRPQPNSHLCDHAEAYVSLCRSKGVDVKPISQCVTCGKREVDSTWKVSSRKTLDIVFILSTESLSQSATQPTEYFTALVHRLKHTLKKSGYTDVRFGVETHGCIQNVEIIHMHTVNGELFSAHHFVFHLKNILSHVLSHRYPTALPDSTKAIKMASRYPFRDEASRLILLFGETEPQDTPTRQLLQEYLIQQNVQFSAVTRSKSHSVGLYRHLSRATGGDTYDIDVIRRNSRQDIHDVTQQITETLMASSSTGCRQCVCKTDISGLGYSECRRTPC